MRYCGRIPQWHERRSSLQTRRKSSIVISPESAPGPSGYNLPMRIPRPVNQPVRSFAPGTPERATLRKSLAQQFSQQIEIPLLIGGKEVRTGRTAKAVMPHRHRHVLATWHKAGAKEAHRPFRPRSRHAANGRRGSLRIERRSFCEPRN